MITTPSAAQLIRTVRAGLAESVAPVLTDPAAAAAIAQSDLVLAYVEAIVDHELEWIREEVADIHATARALVDAGADTDGRIGQALSSSLNESRGDHVPIAARSDYQHATEVLSRCLEAAVPAGGATAQLAADALRRRVDREAAIRASAGIGGFTSRIDSSAEHA